MSVAALAKPCPAVADDDAGLTRTAGSLTRDLNRARPAIYWGDLLASVAVGYAALALAMRTTAPAAALAGGVIAVLALYRALSFIHELTHLKPGAVPGFRLAWNALVGVPLMAPSFLYEGVHHLHHARTRYGTAQDPEYLPLAGMRPAGLVVFGLAAAAAPLALWLRFAVLAPVSLLTPGLRRTVVTRWSALAIDPGFRRPPPEDALRRMWMACEVATSVWAIGLFVLTATGLVPLRAVLVFFAVAAGVALLNQARTLVAHLWESDGAAVSVTQQYLDSVNVPPPGLLPALWAPVGLRYHALHHLLPGLPYHALAEAHRRLSAELPETSAYHRANHRGMTALAGRLMRNAVPSSRQAAARSSCDSDNRA